MELVARRRIQGDRHARSNKGCSGVRGLLLMSAVVIGRENGEPLKELLGRSEAI
jgi:hypothetical protein